MKNKHVLISGAGLAGLTLAYWLKKFGFVPTIVEKYPHLRAEGYKIDIRGAAVEVIKRMGLETAVLEAGTDMQKSFFVDHSGTHLTETSPELCGLRAPGDMEIVRGDLCKILFEHLGDTESLFGDSIKSISQSEKGVQVEFEKTDAKLFDLVIGADGLHSKVRKLAFGDESLFLRELGVYVSFYSIPNFLHLDRVEIEYHASQRYAVAYCPRKGMAKAAFAFPSPPLDLSNQEQQQKALQEAFADAGWEVPRLLSFMKETPDFYFDCMAQVHMPHWTNHRIALVGDAGYAVSPISGQGTSVALVGAYVLAGELAEAEGEYTLAFPRYEEIMRQFVQMNQKLVDLSVATLGASRSSWKVVSWLKSGSSWLLHKLMQFLPGSLIQLCKKWGLRQMTKAANAITLKEYQKEIM